MIRIGCLGAARITPLALIAPVAKRNDVMVSAIASRNQDKAANFAKTYQVPTFIDDYEALVRRDDVDVIYNALPPNRHCDLTILALEAGKPVLCEKPFAMNADEARLMATAAQKHQVLLMEAFHYRFHPAFQWLLDYVAQKGFNNITRIFASFCVEIPFSPKELRHDPALGGGALMDLGCYPLHWLRTLMACEPKITDATATIGKADIDLSIKANLDFGPGMPMAELQTDMSPDVERRSFIRLDSDDESVTMENPIAPHRGYRIFTKRGAQHLIEIEQGPDDMTTYDYQLEHFLACVQGKAEPILPVRDAVANMAAIDAIYRAAGMRPRGIH